MEISNGKLNLTSSCNMDCYCTGIPYTPVCNEQTGDTFFNPCVASCQNYSKSEKVWVESFQDFISLKKSFLVLPRVRVHQRTSNNSVVEVFVELLRSSDNCLWIFNSSVCFCGQADNFNISRYSTIATNVIATKPGCWFHLRVWSLRLPDWDLNLCNWAASRHGDNSTGNSEVKRRCFELRRRGRTRWWERGR